jgi:hypothetical protein
VLAGSNGPPQGAPNGRINVMATAASARLGTPYPRLAERPLRIPMKPARHSNRKPATDSDLKPAGIPI